MPVDAGEILALLPQTQCTRCGYPDCAAYAQAIAQGEAPINQCPPGGAEGVRRLAVLTGAAVEALNPANGEETPRTVVFIDEDWCIGCTLCLDACPTDAIIGANKRMHTVMEVFCTGCELCIPVCPVDCIAVENASGDATGWQAWSPQQAAMARDRYAASQARRARLPAQEQRDRTGTSTPPPALFPSAATATSPGADPKRTLVEAALARARARQAQRPG